jgi:hypothetical protein
MKQFKVIRQIIRLINMPADDQDRPMQLRLDRGGDGREAAPPQPGRRGGPGFSEIPGQFAQRARSG